MRKYANHSSVKSVVDHFSIVIGCYKLQDLWQAELMNDILI